MAASRSQRIIDLDKVAELVPGDRLRWRGQTVEVVEAVQLTPEYEQVVLRLVDQPDALPMSVPARDLIDAEHC